MMGRLKWISEARRGGAARRCMRSNKRRKHNQIGKWSMKTAMVLYSECGRQAAASASILVRKIALVFFWNTWMDRSLDASPSCPSVWVLRAERRRRDPRDRPDEGG
eukprot:GHVU01096701.1.p2 GENE.GHVU01096701.1~~GHVU01096701.1.p2  ORF type:complete len:106 (+),score=10.98 GHVU01096701.1:413-730(+)